jgi:DNA polymerase I-like protein with 3'-5' exonuclease and polymerase domains
VAEVMTIYLPSGEGGAKQGVDDFLASDNTVDDLLALATTELREPPEGEDELYEPETQSAYLVRYTEEADLFHSPDNEAYAAVPVENHRETHPVRSKALKLWLQRRFYDQFRKPPGAQALQEALGVIEAKARFNGEEHEVHVRVAEHQGAIYIDLANNDWEAVEITDEGCRVVSDPPVRFQRRKGMLELPHPVKGGKVDALRRFVNLKDDKDWVLLMAWLVQAFCPTGPYPVLIIQGEQGSAKSTLARMLRAIVDSSTTPVRTSPRNEHDLVIAASNSWVVAFDNLSGLPPWLSDALCRLSTGGGFGTRTLYENDEETLFDATRPVILNGITDVATRADLLDRAIILVLPTIPEEERRPESELWEEFEEALPEILGGLFDAVSAALRELPNVDLASLPRMADFAKWATAAESALGMELGEFMEAYTGSRQEINERALEADPVALAVMKLMVNKDEWVGTAMELLKELGKHVEDDVRKYKTWPKQPQHLSRHLKRLAPVLRTESIEVEDLPRTGGERKKRLYKKRPVNDRHERHDGEKPYRNASSTDDADDDDVTLSVDEGSKDRHSENPIEKPDSTDHDDDDAHDDEMQPFSKAPLIATDDDLRAIIPKIQEAKVVALDSETTGLDPHKHQIRLLQIATEGGTWIIDCFSVDIEPLLEILKDKTLIVHNAMHDLLFLRQLGYVHRGRVVDTMILSRMAHAGERDEEGKRLEHSLEACCKRELNVTLDKSRQTDDWSGELSEEMLAYAAEDARVLMPLYEALEEMLLATDQEWIMEIEERALLAGIEMAHAGVPVDKDRWLGIVEEAGANLGELRHSLDSLVGEPSEEIRKRNAKNKNIPAGRKEKWNWDSHDQIKAAAATVGLALEKTSMDYLKLVDHEFTRALLAYREAKSGLATFGEKYFEPTEEGREVYLDGRLYPSWGMCQADTGRMSCRDPNVQNIPNKSRLGKLRECVIAPEGRCLIKADYSQIELRIVAKIASEEAMLKAYRLGEDLHAHTARSITGGTEVTREDRQLAKAVNFGLLYGQGATGLRNYARDKYSVEMSLKEAATYRESWFETYPAIKAWHRREGIGFDAGEDSARTLTGRLRRVKSFMEKVNHPVQGTGADGLKQAMALFHELLPDHLDAKLIIACHDELVVECLEEQAEEVARFLEEVMITGMNEVVNPGLGEAHPDWVPIEVEAEAVGSWGG